MAYLMINIYSNPNTIAPPKIDPTSFPIVFEPLVKENQLYQRIAQSGRNDNGGSEIKFSPSKAKWYGRIPWNLMFKIDDFEIL